MIGDSIVLYAPNWKKYSMKTPSNEHLPKKDVHKYILLLRAHSLERESVRAKEET